jgi:hypothetical protein
MKLTHLAVLGSVVALSACSSFGEKSTKIESPTPAVTKDQTTPVQGKLAAPDTIDIPSWYVKAPASDENYVFVAGTGLSNDLSMSNEKAVLDAQRKLADKINGVMNAMVKSAKSDSNGAVGVDATTVAVKKLIINTSMTGYHIEDSKIMAENRAYRTFVLVRYPIGDANRILKEKLKMDMKNHLDLFNSGQDELEREIRAREKTQ